MKTSKKICLYALTTSVLTVLSTIVAFAEDKNLDGGKMTFAERLPYALQGTVTGLIMVFAVLALLWLVITISKVIFYDLPKKKASKAVENKSVAPPETPKVTVTAPQPAVAVSETDDGELIAVITAAVAAMIESGEYKDEFVGGFRVVSFKRSSGKAWNRK
ncbi:MAG: OadG family protein [Clostridia bacterium]|nr:OadG family protein [Clostridia bacterium]